MLIYSDTRAQHSTDDCLAMQLYIIIRMTMRFGNKHFRVIGPPFEGFFICRYAYIYDIIRPQKE